MATRYNNGKANWVHGQPVDYCHGQLIRWLLGPCPLCGSVTSTYGGGYSCHNDYCPKSASNFAVSAGDMPKWWNIGVNVIKDGINWCATYENFVNLQESASGFGLTPDDAVRELILNNQLTY